jgi:hypothetical protein
MQPCEFLGVRRLNFETSAEMPEEKRSTAMVQEVVVGRNGDTEREKESEWALNEREQVSCSQATHPSTKKKTEATYILQACPPLTREEYRRQRKTSITPLSSTTFNGSSWKKRLTRLRPAAPAEAAGPVASTVFDAESWLELDLSDPEEPLLVRGL